MTALSEQGVPGALLFTGLLLWIARTSLATKKRLKGSNDDGLGLYLMAVGGSLGIVVAAGMFTDYFKAEVFVWNIALLAVVANLGPKHLIHGVSDDSQAARSQTTFIGPPGPSRPATPGSNQLGRQ